MHIMRTRFDLKLMYGYNSMCIKFENACYGWLLQMNRLVNCMPNIYCTLHSSIVLYILTALKFLILHKVSARGGWSYVIGHVID